MLQRSRKRGGGRTVCVGRGVVSWQGEWHGMGWECEGATRPQDSSKEAQTRGTEGTEGQRGRRGKGIVGARMRGKGANCRQPKDD